MKTPGTRVIASLLFLVGAFTAATMLHAIEEQDLIFLSVENVTRNKPVTATHAKKGAPEGAVDGIIKDGRRWGSGRFIPVEETRMLTVDLTGSYKLHFAKVHTGSTVGTRAVANYRLEYYDGASWKAIPGAVVSNAAPDENIQTLNFSEQVVATSIRFVGEDLAFDEHCYVIELDVFGEEAPLTNLRNLIVRASPDRAVLAPLDFVQLEGVIRNPDANQGVAVQSIAWTQISGPSQATLNGAATKSMRADGLVPGQYVFRLTTIDNFNRSVANDVTVRVGAPGAPSPAGWTPVYFGQAPGAPDLNYGYYMYLPEGYQQGGSYPVMIFLRGAGEKALAVPGNLEGLFVTGLPKIIEDGGWNPPQDMIVIAAQRNGNHVPRFVRPLVEHVANDIANVDASRVYLTGLSLGGAGVWDYMNAYPSDPIIAAAVPISGKGSQSLQNVCTYATRIPVWAFHGQNDRKVPANGSIRPVNAINACPGVTIPAKLSVFAGVAHTGWNQVYNGAWINSKPIVPGWQAFDQDIYSWMLQYTRE